MTELPVDPAQPPAEPTLPPASDGPEPPARRPWARALLRHLNQLFLLVGLVLFVVLLMRLNAKEVARELARVGWMFVPAFGFYVLNVGFAAASWTACVDPERSTATFWDHFRAHWAGTAMNAVTPGGGVGEVLKAQLVGEKLDGDELVASLIAYNVLNAAVIAAAAVVGAAVCVIWLDVPRAATLPVLGVAVLLAVGFAVLAWLIRKGAVARALAAVKRLPGVHISDESAILDKARAIDARMGALMRRRPRAVRAALGWGLCVRLCQIGEVGFLLYPLIGGRHVVLLAVLMQTVSQIINWAAAFIPGKLGVLEAGNIGLFKLAGLDPTAAFAVVLARRVRTILGIGIGLLLGLQVLLARRRTERAAKRRASATEPTSGRT